MIDLNRIQHLGLFSLLQTRERELAETKKQLEKVKEDFEYNLKLVEGRDDELRRYDVAFANLKQLVYDREKEIKVCGFNFILPFVKRTAF